jgi:hypothetical protein
MPGGNRHRNPDRQRDRHLRQRSPQHQLHNAHSIRAQSHANPNFVGAPLHGIRGDAVQPDGRQHQRQESKQGSELGNHRLLREVAVHLRSRKSGNR